MQHSKIIKTQKPTTHTHTHTLQALHSL